MDSNYISTPMEFRHMEGGKSIDFRKTFDLNGKENDEMLRLYLGRAGLSDDIERYSVEQRRAFIYDIIRSNKMPGYWMPQSMPNDAMPPSRVRPPTLSPYAERRVNISSTTTTTSGMTNSSSTGSLQSLSAANNSHVVNRFVAAPVTPPSPSNFVTASKGSKYEISGPMNFQHIAGDMTRDRTRSAFDLTGNANDNVLKKYMIERGIKEDDINGMRRQELIKKIVHSNFTWMPTKQKTEQTEMPKIVYATISTNNEKTPPASPTLQTVTTKPKFSNYATITSRFIDLNDFPVPGDINKQVLTEANIRQSPTPMRISKPSVAPPPPPPSVVTAANNANDSYIEKHSVNINTYATVSKKNKEAAAITQTNPEPMYAVVNSQRKLNNVKSLAPVSAPSVKASAATVLPPPAPPLPPMSQQAVSGSIPMPPLPPAPKQKIPASVISKAASTESLDGGNTGDDRDALLDSIRKGITLKKVDRKSATISGIKPQVAPKRPPVTDFLSELKFTLRRVKDPADNPFAGPDPDESHA